MIPPLGKHYSQQWAEEDGRHYALIEEGVSNPGLAMNLEYTELDDIIFEGSISVGSLTERLLSCFVREGVVPDLKTGDFEDDGLATAKWKPHSRSANDLLYFEEKLKVELMHVGLWQSDEPLVVGNDDIVATLKQKQEELSKVLKVNAARKKRLFEIASKHIAYQEYNAVLDEVNKNVEQAFTKRFVLLIYIETK